MSKMTNRFAATIAAAMLAGAMAAPMAACAEGDYVAFSLGMMAPTAENAMWHSPGYPTDTEVSFGLGDLDKTGFASVAVGHGFANGLRGELELIVASPTDATGGCSGASDGSSCNTHADITDATVRTNAVMANLSYDFMKGGKLQPNATLGAGVAYNKLSDWTRTANPGNPTARPMRTFEGGTETSFAWTAGIGVAYEMAAMGRPMFVDVSYRYFDFGSVSGGTTPVSDNGAAASKGLNFDLTSHALSGLRIPF